MADVRVEDHGSVVLFFADTDTAEEWIDENVRGECTYYRGALVVDPRLAPALAAGMDGDGLEVV